MNRALQRLIQDPLAMKLLDEKVRPGETIIVDSDLNKGQMAFERGAAKGTRKGV